MRWALHFGNQFRALNMVMVKLWLSTEPSGSNMQCWLILIALFSLQACSRVSGEDSCLLFPITAATAVSARKSKKIRKNFTWQGSDQNLAVPLEKKVWNLLFYTNSVLEFSSVPSLSPVWLFATPWTAARQASLSITNSRSLLKFVSINLVMPSNHLILCHPLLLLPSIFPIIRVFSNESVLCIRWPKYWSFSFSISPSSEYSGPISFRIDWFDLLAVQGTRKSLIQPCSSKASFLWCLLLLLLSHFSRVWLCVTPKTAAHQAPSSLELSRQEHWSGLPFPSPVHESEKWKWSRSVVSDS